MGKDTSTGEKREPLLESDYSERLGASGHQADRPRPSGGGTGQINASSRTGLGQSTGSSALSSSEPGLKASYGAQRQSQKLTVIEEREVEEERNKEELRKSNTAPSKEKKETLFEGKVAKGQAGCCGRIFFTWVTPLIAFTNKH